MSDECVCDGTGYFSRRTGKPCAKSATELDPRACLDCLGTGVYVPPFYVGPQEQIADRDAELATLRQDLSDARHQLERAVEEGRELAEQRDAAIARAAEWEAAYHKQCAATDERAADALEATGRAERAEAELARVRELIEPYRAARATYKRMATDLRVRDIDPFVRAERSAARNFAEDVDALLTPAPAEGEVSGG